MIASLVEEKRKAKISNEKSRAKFCSAVSSNVLDQSAVL
jgi:hypothetical protein